METNCTYDDARLNDSFILAATISHKNKMEMKLWLLFAISDHAHKKGLYFNFLIVDIILICWQDVNQTLRGATEIIASWNKHPSGLHRFDGQHICLIPASSENYPKLFGSVGHIE